MSRSWRASGYLLAAGGAAILLVYVVSSLAPSASRGTGADWQTQQTALHQEAKKVKGRQQSSIEGRKPLPPLPPLPKLKDIASERLQLVASTNVYFGGGNFVARQNAAVLLERRAPFERLDDKISALAGYAGSKDVGPGGLVCYHGGQPHTVYEGLGDAQVVQITLRSSERRDHYVPMNERVEFKALLVDFFASLHDIPGAGYQFRNCIGIPGGMPWGPLFYLIADANINDVDLVKGVGDDPYKANTVYIYDSTQFPFHRAETYLQFKDSPPALKEKQLQIGRIGPTGCIEPP